MLHNIFHPWHNIFQFEIIVLTFYPQSIVWRIININILNSENCELGAWNQLDFNIKTFKFLNHCDNFPCLLTAYFFVYFFAYIWRWPLRSGYHGHRKRSEVLIGCQRARRVLVSFSIRHECTWLLPLINN